MMHSEDGLAVANQSKRYIELAAMFKENKAGGARLMEKILSKFCLQEGVTMKKANLYFDMLRSAGLIIFTSGHKTWKYDATAEWDLFRIEV